MVTVDGNVAEFQFFRPQARRVYLAGEFNNWRQDDLPMVRTASGYWVARLQLPSGAYRFRYLADGQWFVDYAAFGLEHGPFGFDGVVRIPPKQLSVQVNYASSRRRKAIA